MAFTIFVWWFSTGLILMAVKRADRSGENAHLTGVMFSLPVLLAGGFGLYWSGGHLTVAGVYVAFLSALAIWGWFEMAFLSGIVTGPNLRHCPEDVPEWERFVRAWGTVAYSEMALTACLIAILLVLHDAANVFGMWTFIILYFARISAKLNVYLGVPNINEEFLPHPVRHLASHFRIAPMNWMFPISTTALSFGVACWLERAYATEVGSAGLVGFTLLATLTALALLEHWLMILPIPDARLWRWMIPDTNKGLARPDPKNT